MKNLYFILFAFVVSFSSRAQILGTPSVCVGSTTSLSDPGSGGSNWSSSNTSIATIDTFTGLITGISPGTVTIGEWGPLSYSAFIVVTVNATPPAILGVPTVCVGGISTLTDVAVGGGWASTAPGVITVGASTGLIMGMAVGTAIISYVLPSGCSTSIVATATSTVAAISGPSSVCLPNTITLSDATTGGTWSTSSPGIVSIGSSSGIAVGIITGTATIYYTLATGCNNSMIVTVDVTPTVTVTSSANCGGTFTLSGSGAGASGVYQWSPAPGLSCTLCSSPVASISTTTTYSVIGTDASGCNGTSSATLDADRISGYISLTAAPTDTLKVWLIQFNVTDSSLISEDSTFSCMDAGTAYYEFGSKPAGSYMVKAKLLSSVPGTSGYVPTYGLSSTTWDMATTLVHTAAATDTQHINMIYGTVPAGPGFISGLISSGAGRGTSGGAPVVGMLVYLKDAATGTILTYTYTDATGAYSFSGIANGAYTIYPVDYNYYTIPWTSVSPSVTLETVTGINFYQHTTTGLITPMGATTKTPELSIPAAIGMYPNPAGGETTIWWEGQKPGNAELIITDITGRKVYKSTFIFDNNHGNTQINCAEMANGLYLITIKSNNINYTGKLAIKR